MEKFQEYFILQEIESTRSVWHSKHNSQPLSYLERHDDVLQRRRALWYHFFRWHFSTISLAVAVLTGVLLERINRDGLVRTNEWQNDNKLVVRDGRPQNFLLSLSATTITLI